MSLLDRHAFWSEDRFHTLELNNARPEDAGVYSVTAQNIHGSVSCHCNLVVDQGLRAYVTPRFLTKLEPEVVELKEGQKLCLKGEVKAYPSVVITWYRDKVV